MQKAQEQTAVTALRLAIQWQTLSETGLNLQHDETVYSLHGMLTHMHQSRQATGAFPLLVDGWFQRCNGHSHIEAGGQEAARGAVKVRAVDALVHGQDADVSKLQP